VLVGAEAHGKHLFHDWEGGLTVHVHLGLFGRFFRHRGLPPVPRETTRLRLSRPEVTIDLVGPSACELLTPKARQRLLARLGPDPLRRDADPDRVWQRLRRSRRALGAALLDQSLFAGVGNVYRAEALFVNALHPLRSGLSLSHEEFERLWQTLVGMLRQGVRQGRIVTVTREELGKPAGRIAREEAFYVYGRELCRRCEERVRTLTLGGRPCHVCETCQPVP